MSHQDGAERQKWAVDILDVQPRDRVLEIGCGSGLAVSLVCAQLQGGHILAVDRSPAMISRARQKNLSELASGKLEFLTGAFAEIDWARRKFDKIFAFNVNIFWMESDEDMKVLRRLLAPKGVVCFFYVPPDLVQLKKIRQRLPECLKNNELTLLDIMDKKFANSHAVCFKASLA